MDIPMETSNIYDDVHIKEEHAYACQDNFSEQFDKDPLRLTPERDEIPEIKIEPCEPEIKMENLDYDENNFTTESVPTELAVTTSLQEHEVVPRSEFQDLLQKYEALQNNVWKQNELKQENEKLKLEISNLKLYKQHYNTTSDSVQVERLNRYLVNSNNEIRQLKNEILKLQVDKMELQSRQTEIFEEHYQYLEKTIAELKNKVKQFMISHQNSLERIKLLKVHLLSREGDVKQIELQLNSATRRLINMKYKIIELSKLKKKFFELTKHNNYLEKCINAHTKTKETHQKTIEVYKKEMQSILDDKNREIKIAKSEVANMLTHREENETTVKLLRDKYKDLFRVADQSKQTVNALKTKLNNMDIELKRALERAVTLQDELRVAHKKTCEYCGL